MFCFIVLHIRMKKFGSMSLQSDYLQFYVCSELTKKEIDVIIVPKGDYCVVSVCTLV